MGYVILKVGSFETSKRKEREKAMGGVSVVVLLLLLFVSAAVSSDGEFFLCLHYISLLNYIRYVV